MKQGGNRLRQEASGAMLQSQGKTGEPQAWGAETILTENLSRLFTHRFQCLCAIRTHHHLFQ